MSVYNNSKPGIGGLHPVGAIDSNWTRLEPLLTAQDLRDGFLMLLPLISGMPDPITGKRAVVTDEQIDKIIVQAVAIGEAETGLQIFPTQHREKLPFDQYEFRSFGYFKIKNRPISSVEALQVIPANANPITNNGVQYAGAPPRQGLNGLPETTAPDGTLYNSHAIYTVPLDWIETANLYMGQINILPINIATTGQQGTFTAYGTGQQSAGGAFFLSILGSQAWVPAFWQFTYTTGFPDGKLPRMVNQYIGTIAAMKILSMLAATYARTTSHSQSLDGISQSISTPGPQLFKVRIEELEADRKMLCKKLKTAYGLAMFSGNV